MRILTTFDINARIKLLKFPSRNKQNIRLRVFCDIIINNPKKENKKINKDLNDFKKGKKLKKIKILGIEGCMDQLHINLAEATNYLVQQFYKTQQKFSCTRTKLGKMLSIIAFRYARNGKVAFDELIYRYNDCGTTIDGLAAYADRDVYIQLIYYDDNKKITQTYDDDLDVSQNIPDKYKTISSLKETDKEIIKEVFYEFGAYSAKKLGEYINVIIEENVVESDGKIDLKQIHNMDKSRFENCTNALIDYLFNGE